MCMISKFEQLIVLFEEIDKTLNEKVNLYVIGGAVMLYHKLKVETKDIDVVVDSLREFIVTEKTLKNMGFVAKLPTAEYKKVNISQMFIREEWRIDLFQKTVCKGFMLSEGMKERSTKGIGLKNINVFLCSPTDIFMFKTFTEREADIADCISLARSEVNWKAMLREINSQIQVSGNKIWITWIGERLDILEERGLKIPIMSEINKLREKYFSEREKLI